MTPDDAFSQYRRHPRRLGSHIRKFLLLTGGILSSIAGSIVILLFLIFTN